MFVKRLIFIENVKLVEYEESDIIYSSLFFDYS